MFNVYYNGTKLFRSLALAALVTVGMAHGAAAADPDTISVRVPVGDLDLRTSAGEATMRHRVKVAAYRVCAPFESPGSINWDNLQDCERTAVRDATPQMQTLLAAARSKSLVATASQAH